MKIMDCYNFYKDLYKNYILIIKSGNFYDVFEYDTNIISYLLGYKVNEYNGIKKIGFPIVSLNKVLQKLDNIKINYLVLEKKEDQYKIAIKKRFLNNEYNNYFNKLEMFVQRKNVLDVISERLYAKITTDEFEEIIESIKSLV